MAKTVLILNTTGALINLMAAGGSVKRPVLAPGVNELTADYWAVARSLPAHARMMQSGEIREMAPPPPAEPFAAPTAAPSPSPAPQAPDAPMALPSTLAGLSLDDCKRAVDACGDIAQLTIWAQSDSRADVQSVLFDRYKALSLV